MNIQCSEFSVEDMNTEVHRYARGNAFIFLTLGCRRILSDVYLYYTSGDCVIRENPFM